MKHLILTGHLTFINCLRASWYLSNSPRRWCQVKGAKSRMSPETQYPLKSQCSSLNKSVLFFYCNCASLGMLLCSLPTLDSSLNQRQSFVPVGQIALHSLPCSFLLLLGLYLLLVPLEEIFVLRIWTWGVLCQNQSLYNSTIFAT